MPKHPVHEDETQNSSRRLVGQIRRSLVLDTLDDEDGVEPEERSDEGEESSIQAAEGAG